MKCSSLPFSKPCLHEDTAGMTYAIFPRSGTWYEASQGCQEVGMSLASLSGPNFRELQGKIQLRLPSAKIWIGLRHKEYVLQENENGKKFQGYKYWYSHFKQITLVLFIFFLLFVVTLPLTHYDWAHGEPCNTCLDQVDKNAPCPCLQKECVIISKDARGRVSWAPENCSSSHSFVCGDGKVISKTKNKTQNTNGKT